MIRTILAVLWILIYLLALLPVFLFELVLHFINRDASELQCQHIIKFLMSGVRFLCGTRLTVKGVGNLPKDEAVLFVPNHRSYFDFVMTISCICPLYNVGKKELAKPPLVGWWIRLMGTLLLDRSSKMAGLQVINRAVEKIKAGKNVMIYPEGTRNKGSQQELLPFREGSMKIAVWGGCRIIPVAILNTREIFEAHVPFIRKTDVTMVFGTPIDPAAFTPEERKHLGATVREVITDMILTEEGKKNG